MLSKPADKIVFADDKLEQAFLFLSEQDWLKKAIQKTIDNLEQNAFYGQPISKKLIPKEYIKKYNIDNLWWVSLPNAWRLVYSVMGVNNIEILAIIIDYFDHKIYERKFQY